MNGAHCLHCVEKGPDLVVSAQPEAMLIPIGARLTLAFTCSRCGARWQWMATKLKTGFLYEPDRKSQ